MAQTSQAPKDKSSTTIQSSKVEQIALKNALLKEANRDLESGDDTTRQEVAKKFVKYYFWVLIGIFIGIPIYNYFMYRMTKSSELLLPLKDIILTYSAVVGPTLGLVIAYYFKKSD